MNLEPTICTLSMPYYEIDIKTRVENREYC